jgi:putative addiction module killer protein
LGKNLKFPQKTTVRSEKGRVGTVCACPYAEWFRGIGEYKIDWGPGYRIYLAKDGLKISVLLGGGGKKRQQKDIDRALALWEDYKLCAGFLLQETLR